jgi:Holliday junction resolvase
MRAAKVDGNHSEICHALRAAGADVISIARVGRGVPDVVVGFRGVNYLLEIKAAGGKLRKGQEEFQKMWRGQCAVVRSVGDAFRVIGIG